MVHILIICTFIYAAEDSIPKIESGPKKSYSKQVLINGIIGLGFTIGAGIFYTKGNSTYEEYRESENMTAAIENWDKVKLYDNIRNACIFGALIFLTRAVYYQLKNIKRASSGYRPVIEFHYAQHPKIILGVSKNL